MAAVDDIEETVERYHQAMGQLVNGNPEPLKEVFSHRDDVSFANPFGPVVHGRDEATRAAEGSASNYRDGEIVSFENVARCVTSELAYTVEVERYRARVGGGEGYRRDSK